MLDTLEIFDVTELVFVVGAMNLKINSLQRDELPLSPLLSLFGPPFFPASFFPPPLLPLAPFSAFFGGIFFK